MKTCHGCPQLVWKLIEGAPPMPGCQLRRFGAEVTAIPLVPHKSYRTQDEHCVEFLEIPPECPDPSRSPDTNEIMRIRVL